MDKSQRLETINNLKLAIELANDGGPQPFTSEEYKLMYELIDELEKQESLKYTDNSIIYISEDDTDNFFADEYDEYAKVITIGTKIRSKTKPYEIMSIISDDCHGDKFECSNGSVLSLKQIEKYYDIII